ncbi:MAG: GNVR domain-containing protein [Candidatus Acidiferrales bacterium]
MEKTESAREEEIVLAEPILPLVQGENGRQRREKTIASLRLLWNWRSFLYRMVGAGLVAATAVAFLIPAKYTSITRLMPPDQSSNSGLAMLASLAGKSGSSSSGGASLGSLGGELLGIKTTGELFVGVLQSRTVQDDLVAKFDLRKLYRVKRWEDARKKLADRTTVSIDQKSGIISIEVTDGSPQRAAAMAQEYVAELNRTMANLNTSSAHKERVFLEGRLSQVQQGLESAEKQFSQFASKNTTIDIQEQGKAMIEAGATLEGQLIATQTELEGLRQIFTDNNVRVRETQARIDEIRRQMQKIGGTSAVASGSENTVNAADNNLLYPPIRQLPLLGVTYADLYRQTKVQEAVYEALTQEYELAKVQEVKETPSVKILDSANIPEKKSSPHRLLIMLLGTVLAGILGVAWILQSDRWQKIDERDPGKMLAQEVMYSFRKHLPWASQNGSAGLANYSKKTKEKTE